MGCFKGKCCITGYPISEGDEVVGIYTFKAEQVGSVLSKPTLLVGMPIRGQYNDYGGLVQTPEVSAYETQLHGVLKKKGMIRVHGHDGRPTNSWVVPRLEDNAYLSYQLSELWAKGVPAAQQDFDVGMVAHTQTRAYLKQLDAKLTELPEGVVMPAGYTQFIGEAKKILDGFDGDLVELLLPMAAIVGYGSWALMHAVAYDELVAEARAVVGARYEALLPEMWTRLEKAESKFTGMLVLPSEFSGFKNLSRLYAEIDGPVVGWYLNTMSSKQVREHHTEQEIVDYALFSSAAAVMDVDFTLRGSGAQSVDTALRKKVMAKVGNMLKGSKNVSLLKSYRS